MPRPGFQPMRVGDSLLWRVEQDPLLRSTVMMVSLLDRPLDVERLMQRMELATRIVPGLRQHVVDSPLGWEEHPHFDLKYHVRVQKAPGEGTLRDVLDFAAPIAMQGFDRNRPLWELYALEELADGRSATVQKIHHSLTDGLRGVQLILALCDVERDPATDPAIPEHRDELGARPAGLLKRAARTTAKGVRTPTQSARRTKEVVASVRRGLAPAKVPLSPLMTGRSLSTHYDVITLRRAELKAAAKAGGGTVNDVFMSAVLGGLRSYHAVHGAEADQLRVAMPISIRETEFADPDANNQFVPARFVVPLTVSEPAERMRTVHELVAQQLAEPSLAFTEVTAIAMNKLPSRRVAKMVGDMLKGVDLTASNVPGPPVDLYFAGARIDAQIPFGPTAGAALNITLLSGPENVQIGINTDPAAIPDPEVMRDCLQQGFDELLKLGG